MRSRIRFVQSFVRTAKEYFRLNFPTDGGNLRVVLSSRTVGTKSDRTIKDETESNVVTRNNGISRWEASSFAFHEISSKRYNLHLKGRLKNEYDIFSIVLVPKVVAKRVHIVVEKSSWPKKN